MTSYADRVLNTVPVARDSVGRLVDRSPDGLHPHLFPQFVDDSHRHHHFLQRVLRGLQFARRDAPRNGGGLVRQTGTVGIKLFKVSKVIHCEAS